ncbi:MAG: hypothetical protein K0R08_1834 [Solimicrobium sp.]|jgi:uncharacterized protein (DUF1499 family)|nr:hypothetical protein [Solimicrobium sp.]
MSENTLIRAVTDIRKSISDAAADYKQDCNAYVQFFKILLTAGIKAAWDHYHNVPSKREAVEDLARKVRSPDPSWINAGGEWEKIEFQFEGATYRITDINFHSSANDIELPNPDLGMTHWLVHERVEKDGKTTKQLGSHCQIPGSLFAYALRESHHLNEIPMKLAFFLDDQTLSSVELNMEEVALHKVGDAHVMKINDVIFIRKRNGQVQIENSRNNLKINADKGTSEKFIALLDLVGTDKEISYRTLVELVASAEVFIEALVDNDETTLYRLYAEFADSKNELGNDRNAVETVDRCVDFLKERPEHFETLKKILPMDNEFTTKSTGIKYLKYVEQSLSRANATRLNNEIRKTYLYEHFATAILTFVDTLEILNKHVDNMEII